MKKCTKCNREQLPSEFRKKGLENGKRRYHSWCRSCISEANRIAGYNKGQYGNSRFTEWRKRNPEKVKVSALLRMAVRKSILYKPDKCSKCKRKIDKRGLQAHHSDYTKPLDVVWVCRKCHGFLHRNP